MPDSGQKTIDAVVFAVSAEQQESEPEERQVAAECYLPDSGQKTTAVVVFAEQQVPEPAGQTEVQQVWELLAEQAEVQQVWELSAGQAEVQQAWELSAEQAEVSRAVPFLRA